MTTGTDKDPGRAPQAPPLPDTPLRFVLYFVGRYRWWYLVMLALEACNSACGILVPYATGRIVKAVTLTHAAPGVLAAFYRPVWSTGMTGAADFALASAAFLLLFMWQTPPWLVVVLCAAAGAGLGLIN